VFLAKGTSDAQRSQRHGAVVSSDEDGMRLPPLQVSHNKELEKVPSSVGSLHLHSKLCFFVSEKLSEDLTIYRLSGSPEASAVKVPERLERRLARNIAESGGLVTRADFFAWKF